ncbi:MAG: hypothetical protein Q4B17_06645 [Lautropia sp.]|nr:hypothetical protein [Lautropia sp.]
MSSHRLIIMPSSPSRTLSAAQKRFNSLLKKIDRQRRMLQDWDEGERRFAEVWASEVVPLKQDYYDKLRELVLVLDLGHDRLKLSPIERETLGAELRSILDALINDGGGDEQQQQRLRALRDKYSDPRVADREAEEVRLLKESVKSQFGVDIDDLDVDLDDPFSVVSEILRRAESEEGAGDGDGKGAGPNRNARAAGRRDAHAGAGWTTEDLYPDEDEWPAKPKRETAAQRRKREAAEAAEQQATQSMQVIFRRLASALHPDREPDPAERERKTALMQRITLAYREGRLLDLLELQLEAEGVDIQKVQGLADDQLKLYNQVLKRQSEQLEEEIIDVEVAFLQRFGLVFPFAVKPRDLSHIMQDIVQSSRMENLRLGYQAGSLVDGRKLRAWLKRVRKGQERDDLEAAFLEDALMEALWEDQSGG